KLACYCPRSEKQWLANTYSTARIPHLERRQDLEETGHASHVRSGRRPCHAFISARRESLQNPRRDHRLYAFTLRSLRLRSPRPATTQQNSSGQRAHRTRQRSSQLILLCFCDLRVDQRVELLSPVRIDVGENCVLLESGVAIAHRKQAFAEVVVGLAVIRFQAD